MKTLIRSIFILSIFYLSISSEAQWFPVLDDVIPLDIAISPDYLNDQTVYVLDDGVRIWISETGGAIWNKVYEADDPNDPSQAVLDIVVSPNFLNDNVIVMIHKNGTMKLSPNRGQNWLTAPAPEGVTGMVFSPSVGEDLTMYCITGALGPVDFFKSDDFGATWGDPVAELALGTGYYSRLWNSQDPMAKDKFAVQYDNPSLSISSDGGETWFNSFLAQASVMDFVFSPKFSYDSTTFVADASDIYRSTNGGDEMSWVNVGNFPGTFGIRFAISPSFDMDHTIFAAVDQVGIIRSTDGGDTWGPFNEDFNSILPISIAISNALPYTLFAGTIGVEGVPGQVYKYQAYTGIEGENYEDAIFLENFPNPFNLSTTIKFKLENDSHVHLGIYDLNGRLVTLLLDASSEEGEHNYFFSNESGILSPGIYACILKVEGLCLSCKLVVIH